MSGTCPALGHLYVRAREARAHMLVDEIVEIADEPYADTAADKIKAEAEARKVRIEARKWTWSVQPPALRR